MSEGDEEGEGALLSLPEMELLRVTRAETEGDRSAEGEGVPLREVSGDMEKEGLGEAPVPGEPVAPPLKEAREEGEASGEPDRDAGGEDEAEGRAVEEVPLLPDGPTLREARPVPQAVGEELAAPVRDGANDEEEQGVTDICALGEAWALRDARRGEEVPQLEPLPPPPPPTPPLAEGDAERERDALALRGAEGLQEALRGAEALPLILATGLPLPPPLPVGAPVLDREGLPVLDTGPLPDAAADGEAGVDADCPGDREREGEALTLRSVVALTLPVPLRREVGVAL